MTATHLYDSKLDDITARMSMARAATLRGRIDRPALETETA